MAVANDTKLVLLLELDPHDGVISKLEMKPQRLKVGVKYLVCRRLADGQRAHKEDEMPFYMPGKSISRRHAILWCKPHVEGGLELRVRDLNSTHGTIVNDEPLAQGGLATKIVGGDGRVTLRFGDIPHNIRAWCVLGSSGEKMTDGAGEATPGSPRPKPSLETKAASAEEAARAKADLAAKLTKLEGSVAERLAATIGNVAHNSPVDTPTNALDHNVDMVQSEIEGEDTPVPVFGEDGMAEAVEALQGPVATTLTQASSEEDLEAEKRRTAAAELAAKKFAKEPSKKKKQKDKERPSKTKREDVPEKDHIKKKRRKSASEEAKRKAGDEKGKTKSKRQDSEVEIEKSKRRNVNEKSKDTKARRDDRQDSDRCMDTKKRKKDVDEKATKSKKLDSDIEKNTSRKTASRRKDSEISADTDGKKAKRKGGGSKALMSKRRRSSDDSSCSRSSRRSNSSRKKAKLKEKKGKVHK